MDTFIRRSRQAPLRRVFMMLGLALVLSAESGTVWAPPFGWEGGRNGRYWLPEDEIDYGEPPPPPRNRPYHSQRPRPQPHPGQDDLRKTLAASVPLLQRMIQLAAEDGGIGHIAEIQDLKRRIEALPKPAPGDSKAARILFDNGAVAYEGGLLADAARYYADARKKDPSDVEIVANLGFTYVKLGNLKTAIEPLTAAATLAPGRSARWANLAEYYARNGQSREAAACYTLAVHFSRNSTKTVEFIRERAQDPDPKVRQAAQQALQLSFVQSINAQAKATLETPLTSTGPKPAPIVSSESEPPTALESSTATPSVVKIDRESVGAQLPNPATVLDEPLPASESESKPVTSPAQKQDNKWYEVRTSTQQCDQMSSSPADLILALRNNGIEPNIQDFRDANGNIIKVNITISNGLTTGTVTSYRHIDDCKAELAKKTAIPDEYK